MYTEIFKTFSEQTENTMAPFVKFNKLFAKNVEQLTEMQLSAMRSYGDMGLTQLKAASEIKDANSMTVFSSQQLATLTKLSQQMMDDSKKLGSIAQEFKEDVDQLVAESIKNATSV